ncbi:MAG: FkbM family methyltransferase, partial [Candidatus Methanomethylicia archaeon]
IKKVDLIKMDIEGAEFDTLKGAVKTLKRDKPDLLVAIYHKGEHFFEIPGWLKKQVPEYNLRFLAFNEASPIIERFVAASVRRI